MQIGMVGLGKMGGKLLLLLLHVALPLDQASFVLLQRDLLRHHGGDLNLDRLAQVAGGIDHADRPIDGAGRGHLHAKLERPDLQQIAVPNQRGVDALAVDVGAVAAVQIARVQTVRRERQHAVHGIDPVDIQADIARLAAADERGRRAERPARARLSAVLQHQLARRFFRGFFVPFDQIGGFHANALDYPTSIVSFPASAKMGVLVEPGKTIGKGGKIGTDELTGCANDGRWDKQNNHRAERDVYDEYRRHHAPGDGDG